MIDWFTGKVSLPHTKTIGDGRFMSVDSNGAIEYETIKRVACLGSFDDKIYIRSCDYGIKGLDAPASRSRGEHPTLEIHGNPVKFLQGHNIFGTSDMTGLVTELMLVLCNQFDISYSNETLNTWVEGEFTISRADCTMNWRLDSSNQVNAWLRSAATNSRMTRRGQGELTREGTLYYGKHSRRSGLKFYNKSGELDAHKLPPQLIDTKLYNYSKGLLRGEAVYRALELNRLELHKGKYWTDTTDYELLMMMIDKLEISEMNIINEEVMNSLPNKLKSVYVLWSDGHDLREMFPKNTFYRHRRNLLEFGIDISIKQTREAKLNNVIPLMQTITAIPEPIPSWAHGTDLYFEPRSKFS